MPTRSALVAALLSILVGGCCAVRGIEGPRPELSEAERKIVDAQVDKAMAEGEWADAWNQAADAGASRERLEEIAFQAFEAETDAAEAMLVELRAEFGGVTESGRARARAVRDRASAAGDWERAARVEILTADDAPAYRGAWKLYEKADPDHAPLVLEAILEARSKAKEEASNKAKETGD